MSIDMNTLISQMIMFFVILGCGFVGAKLGLLKAEVIHGLSSLLMGVICPLMLIAVFPSAVQEENAWDIAKSVIPYALITYPLLTGAGFLTGTLLHFRGAGFETDTNVVTMITDTEVLELPIMNKEEVAFHIIDQILSMQNTDR